MFRRHSAHQMRVDGNAEAGAVVKMRYSLTGPSFLGTCGGNASGELDGPVPEASRLKAR